VDKGTAPFPFITSRVRPCIYPRDKLRGIPISDVMFTYLVRLEITMGNENTRLNIILITERLFSVICRVSTNVGVGY